MEKRDENGETIRSIAVKLLENKLKTDNNENHTSRTIFLLGSKSSGKTTFINIFLDKDENQISESLGLEYTYGRKNVQGHLNEKNVCHIWELGGDTFRTLDILKIPYKAHKNIPITTIIFLDLSQPKTLWAVLEKCINSLHSILENDVSGNESSKLFPTPLLIIGGKYDTFNEFDSSQKKIINKSLRSVALLKGASLMYFSKNDPSIKKKIKDFVNHIGFGTEQRVKASTTDTNKPLHIISGADSWESIGIGRSSFDAVKIMYTSQFPQIEISMVIPDDPSLEAIYREPLIDIMRNEKDDELKLLLDETTRNHF